MPPPARSLAFLPLGRLGLDFFPPPSASPPPSVPAAAAARAAASCSCCLSCAFGGKIARSSNPSGGQIVILRAARST